MKGRFRLVQCCASYDEGASYSLGGNVMETPVKTISRDELKSKLNRREKFTLLETLAKAAYDHAHIPTAKNLPPDEIKTLAPTLVPDKNAEIIVYCANPT